VPQHELQDLISGRGARRSATIMESLNLSASRVLRRDPDITHVAPSDDRIATGRAARPPSVLRSVNPLRGARNLFNAG